MSPLTLEDHLPFSPALWARGGDLQTLAGYLLPSPAHLPDTYLHHLVVSEGDRLALCENRPAMQAPQGILLLLHGLGGHADSPYMLRIAARFLEKGWITLRLNHRGSGRGRGLAQGLYHAGKSEDLGPVLQHIAELHAELPLVVAGFSLSGNMLLKYLGESRQTPPPNLRGAIAICPPIDLAVSSAAMRRGKNRLYDFRFVRLLKRAMLERYEDFPDFPRYALREVTTLYDFDSCITAPHHGFRSAQHYYAECSAKPFLPHIRLPVTIIASEDDPFVPRETFLNLSGNPRIELQFTRSGGHLGYIARHKTPWGDVRWMDYALGWHAQKFCKALSLAIPN